MQWYMKCASAQMCIFSLVRTSLEAEVDEVFICPKKCLFCLVSTSLEAVVHEVCICPKKCLFFPS
jgi:hypothetical protein